MRRSNGWQGLDGCDLQQATYIPHEICVFKYLRYVVWFLAPSFKGKGLFVCAASWEPHMAGSSEGQTWSTRDRCPNPGPLGHS